MSKHTKPGRKRVKKPRSLSRSGMWWASCWGTCGLRGFDVRQTFHGTPDESRRLAAWLIRAAEWMEDQR